MTVDDAPRAATDGASTPGPSDPAVRSTDRPAATVEALWRELVTVALLGTDRRDPPDPNGEVAGAIGDVVADAVRPTPAGRMLAAVAACTAVRRAAVVPGPPVDALRAPEPDDRRVIDEQAARRWHHLVASWPVLEDEWVLRVIAVGRRVPPELVVPMLRRHRRDPVRRARAVVAAGPVAEWIVDHVPDLASSRPPGAIDPEVFAELPELPIPPDLDALRSAPGAGIGRALAEGLERGELAQAHRAVLVNLIARVDPDALADVAEVLGAVDPRSSGAGLASVLADLATTRRRMLDELAA